VARLEVIDPSGRRLEGQRAHVRAVVLLHCDPHPRLEQGRAHALPLLTHREEFAVDKLLGHCKVRSRSARGPEGRNADMATAPLAQHPARTRHNLRGRNGPEPFADDTLT
jgi:hypothetical protein